MESLEERAVELFPSMTPSCHVPPETKPFPVKAGVKQWGCDTATDTRTFHAAAVTADLWWDVIMIFPANSAHTLIQGQIATAPGNLTVLRVSLTQLKYNLQLKDFLKHKALA